MTIILAFAGFTIAFFLKEIPLNNDEPKTQEEVPEKVAEKVK